ncbi:MAG: hypothetical protein ABIS35_13830 [Terracoccus sp.]
MPTDGRLSHDTRSIIGVGHLLLGVAALVVAGVMLKTALAPGAELEGALVAPGLALAVAGVVFTGMAVAALRAVRRGRDGGGLSMTLGVVEIVIGLGLAAAVAVAVAGYGAFEPWRSPFLLPSVLVLALGVGGCLAAGRAASRPTPLGSNP